MGRWNDGEGGASLLLLWFLGAIMSAKGLERMLKGENNW